MTKSEEKSFFAETFSRYRDSKQPFTESDAVALFKMVIGKNVFDGLLSLVTDICIDQNQWELGIKLIEEGLARFSPTTERFHSLAYCLWSLGKLEEAYKAHKMAINLYSSNMSSLKQACFLAIELDKPEEALEYCRKYYDLSGTNHQANLWYAMSLLNVQKYEEAKLVVKEFTSKFGDHPDFCALRQEIGD